MTPTRTPTSSFSANFKRCTTCHLPGTFVCSHCHSITYCSRKCQQHDWRAHKQFCVATNSKEALYPPKPARKHVIRGILFSWDSNAAKFVNMAYETKNDGTMLIDTEQFLKANHPGNQEMKTLDFERNILDDRPFYNEGMKLVFWCNVFEESNQCVEGITGGKTEAKWKGNLLVVGARKKKDEGGLLSIIRKGSHEYVDLEVNDVRDVVDCLIAYREEGKESILMTKQNLRSEFEKAARAHIRHTLQRYISSDNAKKSTPKSPTDLSCVKGVVSLCKGHSQIYNISEFISASFQPHVIQWIQSYGDTLPITNLIQFPLLYLEVPNKKLELQKTPKIPSESTFKQNDFATYMHLNPKTFYPPPRWEFTTEPGGGTIFVMRKDLKPLLVEHCEALKAWGELLVSDWQQWRSKSLEDRSRERKYWGDRLINQTSFEGYWNQKAFRRQQQHNDEEEIPSPYS